MSKWQILLILSLFTFNCIGIIKSITEPGKL